MSRHVIEKEPPKTPRQWLEDVFTQAKIMRHQGLSEAMKITLDEVKYLALLRDVIEAAGDLVDYEGPFIAPFGGEHFLTLEKALAKYRGSEKEKTFDTRP